jgi:hypothetical protein
MPEPDTPVAIRVVTRVADMILAPPPGGVVQVPCSECGISSWLDPDQEIPAGMENAVPVCTRCALSGERCSDDPELVENMRRSDYWADRLRSLRN